MKRDAVITFDYEVYLGRKTGTAENCVLKPTDKILEILKERNAKAIFFVDATWLLFIREHFPADFNKVAYQLKEIEKDGSFVGLHLHPQWLDAVVKDGNIEFTSLRHYKLHSLDTDAINDLFRRGISLLEETINRKITCFRAGGWCIEPFETLKDAFINAGLKYDFSVVPGLVLAEGKDYDIDFSGAPQLPAYRFLASPMKPDPAGIFTEIPLSTYHNNALLRLANKLLLKARRDKPFGDGSGGKERSVTEKLYQRLGFSTEKLSIDKTDRILFRYLLRSKTGNSGPLVVVSHPKMSSPEALVNLRYIATKFNTLGAEDIVKYLTEKDK